MLQQYLLDTNVIVRFLVGDNKQQSKIVKEYFEKAKKDQLKLKLPLFILIEAAHVLRTYYKIPKGEICGQLIKVVTIPYIAVSQRETIVEALKLYSVYSADFVDCVLFVKAEAINARILSFDKDFKKLTKTRRS